MTDALEWHLTREAECVLAAEKAALPSDKDMYLELARGYRAAYEMALAIETLRKVRRPGSVDPSGHP